MQNQLETHKIELDLRKKLSVTGVLSVDGFSEQTLNLTVSGSKLRILGENIKISSYNKNTGNLTADGDFYEIKYLTKKPSLTKRIFK